MAQHPVLPLYPERLLTDTRHMSAEEFGAYCRILFVMWSQGARLPHDPKQLARIAGVDGPRWRKIAGVVTRPLTIADGQVSQKRLTATWLDVQERRRKQAEAATKRWAAVRAQRLGITRIR